MTTIHKAGVIGAGTMGNGIAQACATSGVRVVMLDIDQRAVDRVLRRDLADDRRSVILRGGMQRRGV